MDILSITNSALRYHKSASNLAVVSEYKNAQQVDISTNFAILPTTKSFLWWNRVNSKNKQEDDSCLELWRVKKDNENELERLNKTKWTGVSAVAGSNYMSGAPITFAMGYLNGEIKVKFLNSDYKTAQQFSAKSSSVVHLDYNCNNENIASTHENGTINVFSLNTGVKFDTIKFDGASTLSRFHPTKRSTLGMASYQGTAALYDIFAKKTIFKNIGAHSAPCVDITFTENAMLSCGYDSVINIFDIRKQKVGMTIKGAYGWTTIAMSKCSSFVIGGNMKGELISYDMRNTKKVLASTRVENGGHKITQVSFLSKSSSGGDDPSVFIDLTAKETVDEPEQPQQVNDSFTDMLSYQRGRISDFSSSIVNQSRLSTDSNIDFQPNKVADFESPEKTEEINTKRIYTKRRSSLRTPQLHHIHEEQSDKENDSKFMNTPKNGSGSRNTSTPAVKFNFEMDEVIEVDNESFKSSEEVPPTPETPLAVSFDIHKEFENLEKKLSEKIHIEVGMMNFDEENRYIKVMSQIVDQRQRLQERVNMIEECMGMLLNDDFKINRIMELQAENEELRAQNQELLRRMSR